MSKSYEVTLDGNIVGTCTIRNEGLYIRFHCTCKLDNEKIYRLYAITEREKISLGICVPAGASFVLDRTIPQKKIDSEIVTILAEDANHSNYAVDLSQLQNAYLIGRAGEMTLMIKDLSQDQQGNDPNP